MLQGELVPAIGDPLTAGSSSPVPGITSTAPVLGSPVVSIVFTAPRSRQVRVHFAADIAPPAGQFLICGWRVREGSSIGVGTIIDGGEPSDGPSGVGRGRILCTAGRIAGGCTSIVTLPTAGATYHAATYHYVTAGTGVVNLRSLMIEGVL